MLYISKAGPRLSYARACVHYSLSSCARLFVPCGCFGSPVDSLPYCLQSRLAVQGSSLVYFILSYVSCVQQHFYYLSIGGYAFHTPGAKRGKNIDGGGSSSRCPLCSARFCPAPTLAKRHMPPGICPRQNGSILPRTLTLVHACQALLERSRSECLFVHSDRLRAPARSQDLRRLGPRGLRDSEPYSIAPYTLLNRTVHPSHLHLPNRMYCTTPIR